MKKERLKTFKAEYNEDMGLTLLVFAKRLLEERDLLRRDTGPSDVVNQVIRKFLDGTRRWNKDKYKTFIAFLYGAIRSEISTLYESKYNQRSSQTAEDLLESERFTQSQDSALNKILYMEDRAELLDHLRGDAELWTLACVIIDKGCNKPREIAGYLQVPIEDVRNRLKRLRRRMKGHRPENRSTISKERVLKNA